MILPPAGLRWNMRRIGAGRTLAVRWHNLSLEEASIPMLSVLKSIAAAGTAAVVTVTFM